MSDDLVSEIYRPDGILPVTKETVSDLVKALTEARSEIERLREWKQNQLVHWPMEIERRNRELAAAESELSALRDMLVLCGELGGLGKDETPAAYLRRLIDEVAGVESLRARVREVVGPFARADVAIGSERGPFRFETGTGYRLIEREDLAAARQLMEEVK